MPTINPDYQKFTPKTLFMIFLKRIVYPLIFLVLFFILVFSVNYLPVQYASLIVSYFGIVLMLFIASFLLVLLISVWEYNNYAVALSSESVKISRGIITQYEIGIPYERIKSVNIVRGIIEQIVGVSNVIIMVVGEDQGEILAKSEKIVIDGIDKIIAKDIQNKILDNQKNIS